MTREELRKLVYTDKVTTLIQDGLKKVVAGITTFNEIYKIIEIDNELDYNKAAILRHGEIPKVEKELYDTFGFTSELTVEMAEEEGLSVDTDAFDACMEEAKELARENAAFSHTLNCF